MRYALWANKISGEFSLYDCYSGRITYYQHTIKDCFSANFNFYNYGSLDEALDVWGGKLIVEHIESYDELTKKHPELFI